MRKALLYVLLLVSTAAEGRSQIAPIRDRDPIEFVLQVKQLGEFIERFNLQLPPATMDTTAPHAKERILLSLFDFDYADTHGDEVMEFIGSVLRYGDRIHYGDTSWVAIAQCAVEVGGRPDSIVLVLRTENIDSEMYKWVIVAAEGFPLQLLPEEKSRLYKIFPQENEINFIQLSDITRRNAENILNYADSRFVVDQTSVFYALVATGRLKIQHVQDLQYQFGTSEYTFWVKHYPRHTTNSGWLICRLGKK